MVTPLSKEKLQNVYNNVASRYDWQHSLLTLNSDQKGRNLVIENTISPGDHVLDAGVGTGTTGLMAAEKAGANGKVTLFDLSEDMLEMARDKAAKAHLTDCLTFQLGDMETLPFAKNTFDAGLSTYSLDPLENPSEAARELYRVVKPGGKIGIAHSTAPSNTVVKKMSIWIEQIYWKIPQLSLGCRTVDVLPVFKTLGCKVLFKKKIGFPLWPLLVFVVKKT